MARYMRTEDSGEVFRAVILNSAGDVIESFGPYDNRRAASAMVTRETRASAWRGARTGRVESSRVSWTDPAAPAPEKPAQPLHTFSAWPKTPRLLRDCTVTEKLDGTNAAIAVRAIPAGVTHEGPAAPVVFGEDGTRFAVFAQSRNRIITPDADNAGFARWVWDNAAELVAALGEGLHYGEWWGSKVGRKYGLDHKRFSLFNTDKHAGLDLAVGGALVNTVPVLYQGPFSTLAISAALAELATGGSVAAPGFDRPEGVCVFHHASRQVFKVTLDNQDAGKWELEALAG
jgi:hypothetical protein